jgi:hypothetical protein
LEIKIPGNGVESSEGKMTKKETNEIGVYPDGSPPEPRNICSIEAIHRQLDGAIENTCIRFLRVRACVSGIRNTGQVLRVELSSEMAHGRSLRTLDAAMNGKAHQRLEAQIGGPFAATFVGWSIVADIRLAVARDGRVAATIRNVVSLEPSLLQQASLASYRALSEARLLTRQKLLSAPSEIRSVGVICPTNSEAQADVDAVLGKLHGRWKVNPVWLTASFEGRNATSSLVRALNRADRLFRAGDIQLVLMVRGGGRPQSLSFLDAHPIARRLALMEAPVITGIGHAANSGLLDQVAWRATETPTAAAQLVRRLKAAEAAKKASIRPAPIVVPEDKASSGGSSAELLQEPQRRSEEAIDEKGPGPQVPRPECHTTDEHGAEFSVTADEEPDHPEQAQVRGSTLPIEALPGLKDGVWPQVIGERGLVFDADQALQEVGLTLIFRDGFVAVKVLLPEVTRRH